MFDHLVISIANDEIYIKVIGNLSYIQMFKLKDYNWKYVHETESWCKPYFDNHIKEVLRIFPEFKLKQEIKLIGKRSKIYKFK